MKTTVLVSFLAISILVGASAPLRATSILYNNLPNPMPPSSPSLGFQPTQTAVFGDLIQLVSGAAALSSANLIMTDLAIGTSYPGIYPDPWSWPLTLTIYAIDSSSGTPQPGAVIGSVTQTFIIPWRPEADPTCPGGTAWRAGDGN